MSIARPLRLAPSLLLALLGPGLAHAQQADPGGLGARLSPAPASARASNVVAPAGEAAFLFAYAAKPGMNAEFEAGYRRHLQWHGQQRDSITWLAWTVVSGAEPGLFIDGAFGLSFRAFDERVDPRGDVADAARNVTAYAEPVQREVFRLRGDLGSSTALESGRPAAMQRVLRVSVRPGAEREFEQALAGVGSDGDLAVYERLSGGERPSYLIVSQLAAWSDLEDTGHAIERALRAVGPAIIRADGEVWAWRPDLTYVPAR